MAAEKKGRTNTGVFFLLAAMFLVMGFLVSRGFLAIGFIFLIIGMASIGRPRAHFLDEEDEAGDDHEFEDTGN